MKLRTLIFWPHLIAGVLSGLVILLMSVTGVLLTYERQLIAWSNSHLRSVAPLHGTPRIPLETLLANLRAAHPGLTPASVTLAAGADAPVIVNGGPQRDVYVDAYSGLVLGEGTQSMRRTMSELRAWHRWLAVDGDNRAVARAITGWSNVIFAFLVLSGVYLWFPRQWTWPHLKPALFFSGKQGKARDFNWHNVIGLWSAVPLFVVAVSAVPISFPWGNALVYRAVGETPPAGRGGAPAPRAEPRALSGQRPRSADRSGPAAPDTVSTAGLDALVQRAASHVPGWRTLTLRLPSTDTAPAVFAVDTGDGGQPQRRSTLTLDRQGAVVAYESFSDQTPGRRIRSLMRFAHTGEVLGIAGQTVAGLASAGGCVLVWTGIALAWRRAAAWIRRARGRTADVADRRSAA